MIKRLMDSVVVGFGLSAGKKLFDEAVEDAGKAFRDPTPEEQAKAEEEARKQAVEQEKRRAKELREAEKSRKRQEAEIDDELAALKRKMGK